MKFIGKSTPDQYSAISKRKIGSSVRQGLLADTPENVCKCIKSQGGTANTLLLCGGIQKQALELGANQKLIEDISKFHDFAFESRGVRVWKQSGIGDGHFIKLTDNLGNHPEYKATVQNPEQLSDDFKILKNSRVKVNFDSNTSHVSNLPEGSEEDEEDGATYLGDAKVFDCGNPLCRKKFTTLAGQEHHKNGLSNCIQNKRSISISGMVSQEFAKKFGVSNVPQVFRERRQLRTFMENLKPAILFDEKFEVVMEEGGSLHKTPTRVVLNSKQKKYLLEIFEDGMQGKKKAKADIIEKKMRYVPAEGNEEELLFHHTEWLTEQRIKGEFSRIAAMKKKKPKVPISEPASVTSPIKAITKAMDNVLVLVTPNKEKKRKAENEVKSPPKAAKSVVVKVISDEEIEDSMANLDAIEDCYIKNELSNVVNNDNFEKKHPIQV